ncbi:uncharacterized protein LOC101860455 [Aplysia californica]|uniref:Uncharacterized protein LOC101860455 n=1 Tax=Aplysia californica TaxID=6500 RepID=A0ABM1ACB2_APLCA|nr:uncharacterized protein LOC101860455 [Aplysia californica]
MEQQLSEKRKKTKQNKSNTINDSSYGSMITGTSSSSSLSLSLFSESDLAEAPSTSGCSSEMASAMQSKEKKKERAKEFMKKLKSMLPMKERTGKMDTLSTLEQLVNSMRQLNEEQKRGSEFKTPPPHNGSYQGNDALKLHKSDMHMTVSMKNHVILATSDSLMEHLGYPVDWWRGRLLRDFIHKRDINTVNGCIAMYSMDEPTDTSDTVTSSHSANPKESSKYFYARIRRFRKLGAGFNIQNVVSFCPFMMMITYKEMQESEEEAGVPKKGMMLYCHPLVSAYEVGKPLPDQRTFSLRHSLHCNYTYVHPNAVRLLGFLPQDFNGMSIFDLYHPDDYQQLLDIHKKILLSMGQPFKSGGMRLKTRNGCYVEVETEWSSFINPWSMRLEFIIGQHKVITGPSRPDLFEDLQNKQEKFELSPDLKKVQEKILEVLKKPIQGVFTEPAPVAAKIVKDQSAPGPMVAPAQTQASRETEAGGAKGTAEKSKGNETAVAESKSTVIDDKGISSIYNQLNYSHNIKRFLMSHPKSFSNLSDEDSVMTRDDSEDEAINDEEEMPLEIPVVKPPSCGSSTQVHVSEQGHGEEMLSPPTFGDEAMPPREAPADNIHFLTEETLKKHTKIQERLYLQRISEEQPMLLNMRRIKSSRNTSHQKRPRPREAGEEMDTAKHPCTKSGVFRSSSNIFMQSFPTVTSTDITPSTSTANPIFGQAEIVGRPPFDSTFLSQSAPLGFQPFPAGYHQTGNQPAGIAIPAQPIQLMPRASLPLSCLPPTLAPMIPNHPGLLDSSRAGPDQNIQWPYYPQTGYTLLPQVMAGFYRPLLQPVQVQAMTPQPGAFMKAGNAVKLVTDQVPVKDTQGEQPAKKSKMDPAKNSELDNPSSSVEDTASSILYLLDADSSTFEDSDNRTGPGAAAAAMPRMQNKRSNEPPWLRGVKWNNDVKMRYTLPQRKLYTVLKMDDKMLKKASQGDLVQASLEQLMEDISMPDHENAIDEEADYQFYPGDEPLDELDMLSDAKIQEAVITGPCMDMNEEEGAVGGGGDDGGGGGGGGRHEDVLWSLGTCEHDEDNYDTPVNSHSEDEKAPPTPTQADANAGKTEGKRDESPNSSSGSSKATEGGEMVSMETVFMSNSQSASGGSLAKRGGSPKDCSLSGDEGSSGSDGGQKGEMEDSQSNCSKVSSDMTPSDDRSNEEAGSSLKESDASMKHLKDVSSVASSNSSNETPEIGEAGGAAPVRDIEEIFKKLFVPLKVRVREKLNMPKEPYWLVEAHLSQRVAMTYKLPSLQLEDVLSEDKKKMSDLVQSATVKQQLLQLLNEVDIKSASVVGTSLSFSSPVASSSSSYQNHPVMSFTVTEPTTSVAMETVPAARESLSAGSSPPSKETTTPLHSMEDKVAGAEHVGSPSSGLGLGLESVKEEEEEKKLGKDCASKMESSCDQGKVEAEKKLSSLLSQDGTAMSVSNESLKALSVEMGSAEPSIAKSSLCEETAHLTLAKSSSFLSLDSMSNSPQAPIYHTTRLVKGRRHATSSDTNTDPIADESQFNSSAQSRSSSSIGVPVHRPSRAGHSQARTDAYLKEYLQAMETSSVSGQNLEDVIMNKIFVPKDSSEVKDMMNDFHSPQ